MTDSDDLSTLDPNVRALLADARLWEEPSDELADRVVSVVRSESGSTAETEPSGHVLPRWMRPALLGAAAVVALLVGAVVVFSALDGGPGGTQVAAALTPTGLVPDVEGVAEFTESDAGVAIALEALLPHLDGERYYEAWVLTADERVIAVGTFRSGGGVRLWAGVDLGDIRGFSISREHAEYGDSIEQRGSGEVVLKATIVDRD
jgi:Anti-sigma-K factor rskA, C-terminal